MNRILTAEEFLTLVLAKIKLKAPNHEVVLDTAVIDRRFEEAYDMLISREAALGVTSNFTFRRDPLYGNTAKFRDALLSLRERRLIQLDPLKRAYRISLSAELAQAYMDRSVLADNFLGDLVDMMFPEAAAPISV